MEENQKLHISHFRKCKAEKINFYLKKVDRKTIKILKKENGPPNEHLVTNFKNYTL